MELIARLSEVPERTERAVCMIDDNLYIVDGNSLYKLQVKRETFWEYLAKKLGVSRLIKRLPK